MVKLNAILFHYRIDRFTNLLSVPARLQPRPSLKSCAGRAGLFPGARWSVFRAFMLLWSFGSCLSPAGEVQDWRTSFGWYSPVEGDFLPGETLHLPVPWHALQVCTDLQQQLRLVDGEAGQWPFQLLIDRSEPMPRTFRGDRSAEDPFCFRHYVVFKARSSRNLRFYYGGEPVLRAPLPVPVIFDRSVTNGTRRVEVARRFPTYAASLEESLRKPLLGAGALFLTGLVAIVILRVRFLG